MKILSFQGWNLATLALNQQFYKSPAAIPGLFEILSTSSNPAVRQLAAVELRKRISAAKLKHWRRLDMPIRTAIKARLLQLILTETVPITRHSIARVISEIADLELPEKMWPELLDFLMKASDSPAAHEREVVIFTLYTLMDTVVGTFAENLPQIYNLFAKALQDPESLEVRATTVQALGRVSEFMEADEKSSISTFQSMIPQMLVIIEQSIMAGDEIAAQKGFDTLETLLIIEVPLINPYFAELVKFNLNIGTNKVLDESLRIMALNCLMWSIKFKKSKFASADILKPVVDSLITIGAEDEPEDPEDDSVARTAFRCLDSLATSLSPQALFPILYSRIQECFSSPEPVLRKAAVMALGVTVEGCSQFIQPHVEQLWPFIDAGLEDGDVRVRRASCAALSCICEMLPEECGKRHEVLIPRVSALLNDDSCQRNAMTALDGLLEAFDGETIGLYLHPLMERLVPMIDTAPPKLKGTVVGAIGSAAYAAKGAFEPYFDACMQRITPFLSLKDEGDEQDLRGVTQDTIGTLASAVGKEKFRPYLDGCLKIAFEAIELNSPSLRECSMIFFGILAKVYEEEFVAHLPRVMPAVLASVGQPEEDEDSALPSEVIKGFRAADDEEEEAEVESDFVDVDDVDLDDDSLMKATTAVAVEKSVAADALAELFEYTKSSFLPYLEPSVKALTPLLNHFYPTTRKAAATTLLSFISIAHELTNPGKLQPGLNNICLSDDVRKLINVIVPEVMTMWEGDDECDVVCDICSSLSSVISGVGAGLLAPTYLDGTYRYILQILERKSPAQLEGDLDETIATGELSEAESNLIGSAADFVGSFATVLGADFAQAFSQFLPAIAKYYDSCYSATDRNNSVGALAEAINGLGNAISPFTEVLLQLGLNAVKDEDIEVRSNAAFFLGSLVFWTDIDITSQYMRILEGLQPLFIIADDRMKEKSERAKDNAAGAIARMILKNKSALPLDQVLPAFFEALPLKQDFLESAKCFDAIHDLVKEQHPSIQAQFEHILSVFSHVLTNSAPSVPEDKAMITPETRAQIIGLIQVF
ncbi:karyopherin Kap123 [Phakopsora pachyrhizi]|nr:karyopherin Kap123 [Phakopsora pachyrhizi]